MSSDSCILRSLDIHCSEIWDWEKSKHKRKMAVCSLPQVYLKYPGVKDAMYSEISCRFFVISNVIAEKKKKKKRVHHL